MLLAPRVPLLFDRLTNEQLDALRREALSAPLAISDAVMDCIRTELLDAIEAGESFGDFRLRLRHALLETEVVA